MIDPRALQQHFKRVQQKEQPSKPDVPRVPDMSPLTAVQAISVPIEIEEQIYNEPEVPEPFIPTPIKAEIPKIPSIKKKESINLVINVPPPIKQININEIEENIEDNPYGYTNTEQQPEDYDPYGYYSGPKF